MLGQRRDSLIRSLKEFLEKILEIPDHENKITISVVLFANISRIIFKEEIANINLLELLNLSGIGTCFEYPFFDCYKLLTEAKSKDYSIFQVIFMSDGHANFPKNALTMINNDDLKLKDRTKYEIILFGNDFDGIMVNKQIAKELNGNYSNQLDEEMLKSKFVKMIEVINEQNNFI